MFGFKNISERFPLFYSLASNLQLTFTGFFHKAGTFFQIGTLFYRFHWSHCD